MWCCFVHESLKEDHKKKMMKEKENVKWWGRIKRSSLRFCCVFQVIIHEK